MLIFTKANLVLFAAPKTGSTAHHQSLRGLADITLGRSASFKHMSVRKYEKTFAPFLEFAYGLTPERAAVIRDPVDYLGSWYRYRQRPKTKGTDKSTIGIDFETFLEAVMEKTPPPFADVGRQAEFVTTRKGGIRIDHLFAHYSPLLDQFLAERLKRKIDIPQRNMSPQKELSTAPELVARLRQHLAADFDLFDKITQAGGHLITPITRES